MTKCNRFFGLFTAILMAFCGTVFGDTVTETINKEMAFGSGGIVTVKNVNGRILVKGWDKEVVKMEAVKTVKGPDEDLGEEILKKIKITIEETRDRIYIKTKLPNRRSGGFGSWLRGRQVNMSVRYVIYVPRNCDLKLTSTNGSVEAAEVEGRIRLSTTNGKIVAESLGGELQAYTTNGSIEAVMKKLAKNADMDFETTNGSIRLTLPESAGFRFKANTVNGSIRTDFPMEVEGKYRRRKVRGEVNGGGALVTCETVNGSISLHEG